MKSIAEQLELCRRALRMLDWTITFSVCSGEDMPLAGALAVCSPTPTRKCAHVFVVEPWPDGESLAETLMHEVAHAKISPLTALIEPSAAATMLEEGIVEDLGIAFAAMEPGMARAAARALEALAPPLRARISARARRGTSALNRARSGGTMMNPDTVQKLLDALIARDEAAMAEIGKQLLVEAASGGDAAPPSDGEPGMEESMDAKDPKPAAGPSPAAPPTQPVPEGYGRAVARQLALVEENHQRARRTADKSAGVYIRGRLAELRREGVKLDTAFEQELSKMADDEAFDRRVADVLRGRALATPGGQRARAGEPLQHGDTPPPNEGGKAPVDAETLRKEGASDSWIAIYTSTATHDSKAGDALLAGFRDPVAMRARNRHGVGGGFGRAPQKGN